MDVLKLRVTTTHNHAQSSTYAVLMMNVFSLHAKLHYITCTV